MKLLLNNKSTYLMSNLKYNIKNHKHKRQSPSGDKKITLEKFLSVFQSLSNKRNKLKNTPNKHQIIFIKQNYLTKM